MKNKVTGLNRKGTGLELTIDNIPRIKKEINNPNTKYSISTINKYKKYIEDVEPLLKIEIPINIQKFINRGILKQWNKYPNIFFISKLRRTALILKNNTVSISNYYSPENSREKRYTESIMDIINN